MSGHGGCKINGKYVSLKEQHKDKTKTINMVTYRKREGPGLETRFL